MHLFVDNLINVDFSYLCPDRGMLGETWLANTVLEGSLNEEGMVCDFGIVKKTLRSWLDDQLDHRLLVPTQSPWLSLTVDGDDCELTWQFGALQDNGQREHSLTTKCPRQALALVDAETITDTSVAAWSIEQLKSQFPGNLDSLELSFSLETIDGAFYHYSHGLKKHAGNCQRIAHGHRSRIEIFANGQRSDALEQDWAKRWADIYIGTQDDMVAESESHVDFAYTAQQGLFFLSMPKACCYMIDTDTTVELLASHIAKTLKTENPELDLRVRAFEGLNKGAQVIA